MAKVFQIIIVAIALTSTAYSQQVRSSYFSVEQLGTAGKTIVRTSLPLNMLVVSSFSNEDRITKFAFLKKNSNVVKYIELPYNYTVNDFVILDSCIYFCGQTGFGNKAYIGMSAMTTSLQGANTYCILTIDSAATLTKLVAYKGTVASAVGITAIGTPKNTAYTSCVVDVNNYRNSDMSWKYWYGQVAGEEITDICDAGALLATVAKVKPSNGTSFFSPSLLLRTYKKDNIFATGMSNIVHKYSNYRHPYGDGGYLVENLDGNNIAVVSTSSEGIISTYYPITISKININTFVMNNKQQITYDSTRSRTLLDLEYFPTTNSLGILTNVPSTMGELLFANMSKTSAYTSSRLRRDDNLFKSITESNNGNFAIICSPLMTMTENVPVLFENISIFKDSQCSTDASMPVSAQTLNQASTTETNSFIQHNKLANWIHSSTTLYETTVNIHCANYYK